LLAASAQRGDTTIDAPPSPGISPADAAREVPALVPRKR
jgi:isoquinoline 1-oxidoreductase alpha subunit